MLLAKLLHPFFFGAVHFVFSVAVLLYCFGPRNLWADAPASLDTLFIAANRRLFACIFWFVGLGIGGALLYRLIALAAAEKAEGVTDSAESNVAYQIESYFDWPSIRLLTFVFALGGNFSRVFAFWRNKVISGVEANDTLLTTCGAAALPDPSQSEGMHLLDRSLIIFLIVAVVLILL